MNSRGQRRLTNLVVMTALLLSGPAGVADDGLIKVNFRNLISRADLALYSNLDYSFTPQYPDGTFLDYRSFGGGSPTLRRQLSILKQFMEGFDFVRMKREPSVIKSVSGGFSSQVLAERVRAYAIYLHIPIPWKPKNVEKLAATQVKTTLVLSLPAGSYHVEWIDTKNGKVVAGEQFEHSGSNRSLESPTFTADIALRIVAMPVE